MSNSQNTASNSSFVSIRYAPSSKGGPDANKLPQTYVPVIDIEALRSISRIVLAIKERIAGAGQTNAELNGQTRIGPDGSGPETDSGNRGENNDGQKAASK